MQVRKITGNIITLDEKKPRTHYLLIEKERIVATEEKQSERKNYGVHIIIRDGYAYPAFVDSHVHISSLGKFLDGLDLRKLSSIKKLAEMVRNKAKQLPPGDWIYGRGWDQERFIENRYPTRHDIDPASPENPVILYRACHHVYLLNSKALEICGITKDTPDPPGGIIDRDSEGIPTGILRESAYNVLVYPNLPTPSLEDKKKWILLGLSHAVSKGLCYVHTNDTIAINAYEELRQENKLPLRVLLTIPKTERLKAQKQGYVTGKGDDWLRIGRVKFFADGSLGGETAALREPYQGSENRGVLIQSEDVLARDVKDAILDGWEVEIHAIGDRAADIALEVINNAKKEAKSSQYPHLITHCQVTPPDLIEEMAKSGVIANIQPIFINTDMNWAEERLGSNRVRFSYAWKSMIDKGVFCAGGSDAPIEPIDPLFGIYSACTRKNLEGSPEDGWFPEQRLSINEALKLYTINGAIAGHLGDKLGVIKEGKYADIVILDRDLLFLDPDKIKEVKVVATIIGGKLRYLASDHDRFLSIVEET